MLQAKQEAALRISKEGNTKRTIELEALATVLNETETALQQKKIQLEDSKACVCFVFASRPHGVVYVPRVARFMEFIVNFWLLTLQIALCSCT